MNIHDATEVAYKNGYEDGMKTMKHNYDMLIHFFKTHPVCRLCKYYDKESLNYGYTTACEDCGWYPWADEETVPYHWEIKENLSDRDFDE